MHLNLSKSAVYTSVTKFSKRNWGPLSPLEADRVRDWQGLVGSRLIDVVRQAECQCYTLTYLTTITINHRGYYPALILQYHKIVISPHITILHQLGLLLGWVSNSNMNFARSLKWAEGKGLCVSGGERNTCQEWYYTNTSDIADLGSLRPGKNHQISILTDKAKQLSRGNIKHQF